MVKFNIRLVNVITVSINYNLVYLILFYRKPIFGYAALVAVYILHLAITAGIIGGL